MTTTTAPAMILVWEPHDCPKELVFGDKNRSAVQVGTVWRCNECGSSFEWHGDERGWSAILQRDVQGRTYMDVVRADR